MQHRGRTALAAHGVDTMEAVPCVRAGSGLHAAGSRSSRAAGAEGWLRCEGTSRQVPPARTGAAESEREAMLREHLGLVHHVARKLSRTLSADVDFDELVTSGTMGLMNAVDTFDPARGLAFSTFAAPRIRGAILDELRRHDHVPRSYRRKSRELAAAREALMRRHGTPPSRAELAEYMGLDLETFCRWEAEVEGVIQISIDRPVREGQRGVDFRDLLPDSSAERLEEEITLREEVELLREAILALKEQERVVLSLYYFEELKLHEIASILGLTESRVSQVRTKAITKLRSEMAPLREAVA